jgi:hypothetical protein
LAEESRGALRREVLALRKENAALRRQVSDQQALIEKLQSRIAILEKVTGSGPSSLPPAPAPKSASAPPQPKPRGRPPGHSGTSWTKPGRIDEVIKLPLVNCPECGGGLTDWRDHQDHIVVDLPAIRAIVRCFRHERGYCPHCRKTVRSPLATDEPPQGHLGLRLLSLMTELRTKAGISYHKLAALLSAWGCKLSAGTLAGGYRRVATWLVDKHRELLAAIRDGPVKHADETSWPVNGRNGWAWAFVCGKTTVYVNEPTRSGAVPRAVLGPDPDGVLVTDFYAAYPGLSCAHQYCWRHLLSECKEVAAEGDKVAIHLREELGAIYRRAELLAVSQTMLSAAELERQIGRIAQRLSHLRQGSSRCRGVERIKNRIAKYQEQLLTFLRHPDVEPTNNRAERAIRPLVIVRKMSGGSRSWDGARALAILASCQQSLATTSEDWLNLLRAHVRASASRVTLPSVLDT